MFSGGICVKAAQEVKSESLKSLRKTACLIGKCKVRKSRFIHISEKLKHRPKALKSAFEGSKIITNKDGFRPGKRYSELVLLSSSDTKVKEEKNG